MIAYHLRDMIKGMKGFGSVFHVPDWPSLSRALCWNNMKLFGIICMGQKRR